MDGFLHKSLSMQLTPEQLTAQGYTQLDKLDHLELVPFVRLYLNKPTVISRIYIALILMFFAVLVALVVYYAQLYSLGKSVQFASFGMLAAFLLIPVHEYIHVLAYKYVGAKRTSYDAHWKKFYFMALADRFVADKKEFQIVAMAPFVTITFVGISTSLLVGDAWTITAMATVLVHGAFCSGDFGMLSYFYFHKDKEIVTYDDVPARTSYFFARKMT